MKRPWFVPLAVVLLLAALMWLASARVGSENGTRDGRLSLSAKVRVEEVSVVAPSLNATRPLSMTPRPVIAGALTSATVSVGDHVTRGQIVATLDDRALALRVAQAQAAARGARARVGVVEDNLTTVAGKAADLADTRTSLRDTLAELRTSRAEIVSNLEAARALAGSAPATLPPGAPDLRAAVARLEAALAKVDAGIAKVNVGLAKIDAGSATLTDARSQLRGARDVLTLIADAADAAVAVADARQAVAGIRAPCDGVVTWIAEPGCVLFAGGPVARIVPDGPVLLDTYVDAEQAAAVIVGARAAARADSLPDREYAGRVSDIGPSFEFPPTAFATQRVHMTRAFRVTVALDADDAPFPPGTPADLTISTRSE